MKSLIVKIYLYRIFAELMLLYPLYNVMFADRGGLNTFQISTLLTVWSVIILVAEIPSGAIADKYSRRNILGIAQLIRSVGYGFWVFMPTYWGYLIGLALWGLARALTSGTFEALTYDELKGNGSEQRYAKVIGRSEALAMFFGLGSTLAATPIFLWLGYPGILWGSILATLISGAIAFSLPRRKQWGSTDAPHYKEVLQQAVREVIHSPTLLRLIVFGVFVGMLFRVFDEYASLIIKDGGISVEWVPVVSALVFLPVILIGFVAHRLEKLPHSAFVAILAMAGLSLLIAGRFLGVSGLVLFSIFMLLTKVTEIVFGAKVQHAIQGKTRATITSVNSFGIEVTAAVSFLAYGLMARIGGTALSLETFGLAAIVVAILYLLASHIRTTRTSAV